MRGREGGTIDELRASVWLADQMRQIGVEPMGDDGTYFQWWNILRTRIERVQHGAVGDRHSACGPTSRCRETPRPT